MVGPTNPPGGSRNDDSINFDDPFYVYPSNDATTTIVTIKLTGNENFHLWRSSMSRALKARNKLRFFDGSFKKDFVESSKVSKWEMANVVVCS